VSPLPGLDHFATLPGAYAPGLHSFALRAGMASVTICQPDLAVFFKIQAKEIIE